MALSDKINADIKAAMLAKESSRLEALRAVKSSILLAKTETGSADELTTDAEIKLLQKLVKQRKESAQIYVNQNRADLAEIEVFQAKVIESYLPEQLSEEELIKHLQEIIEQTGANNISDLGKVMGLATKKLAGKVAGNILSSKVKELLSR